MIIRSPQDVMEAWNDVKKGVKVVLWCDGLKESNPTRKQSKKRLTLTQIPMKMLL